MTDSILTVTVRDTAPVPLDVRFTCPRGRVLALFGPSGSGKTTILRSIAGLRTPQDGRVAVGDAVWFDSASGVNVPPHLRRTGLVFQDYALFPHLTTRQNVTAALGHCPRAVRTARAMEVLALVRLEDKADRLPSQLSGGERQRVAVARALARDPHVLLLDEPFSAVDRPLRRALQDEIARICRSVNLPIILVTHDFDDVVRLADDLALLREGRIVESGPLDTMSGRPDLRWLREVAGLGAVIPATVSGTRDGLAEIQFDGGVLLAPVRELVAGTAVRVRVPAREVILATSAPTGLSLHNVLLCTVTAIVQEPDGSTSTVQMAMGGAHLLAEVTPDAVSRLGIRPGASVYALVKSLSLDVRPTEGGAYEQTVPRCTP